MSKDNIILLDAPRRTDNLVDLFSGCGGSGGGLLDATEIMGRRVRGTFVNHWDTAIRIHTANHPEHRHMVEDLFTLDPVAVFPAGTACSLLWASPSCTHFSVARGASCVNAQSRSHAFSIVDWVRHLKPEAVICENVKEFLTFGPVMQQRHDGELVWTLGSKPVRHPAEAMRRQPGETEDAWSIRMLASGYKPYEVPDPSRKGEFFDAWMTEMQDLGYDADHRLLRSADYGDPTIRQRLFVYFVRRGNGRRIVWPEPYAQAPPKAGTEQTSPMLWRTARDIIDWANKGSSVFTRPKGLADNTFRRLAIGLVKYGLKEFLVSSAHGSAKASDCDRRVHDPDQPLQTLTAKGDRGVVQARGEFITPNFGEAPGQLPRTHSVDAPLPTVTSHGAGGIVHSEAYIVPKDAGHLKDWVKGVDQPVSAITTCHSGEGLVQPSIIQMKGKSTAQSVDGPLTAITAHQSHYVLQPALAMLDNQRGTGVVTDVDNPLRTVTAGGKHQALVVAQETACGGSDVVVPADGHPRVTTFLHHLTAELRRRGRGDVRAWVCIHDGAAYPAIELDGRLIRIDLFYRMLTPLELQRAMGFPDDMLWPNTSKVDQIKAIGNSVSRGVSRALGLAWYSQDPDVWQRVKHLYQE